MLKLTIYRSITNTNYNLSDRFDDLCYNCKNIIFKYDNDGLKSFCCCLNSYNGCIGFSTQTSEEVIVNGVML